MSPPNERGPATQLAPKELTTAEEEDTRNLDSSGGGNLWDLALEGKVRPAPREPETTHYGCSCCRWWA